MALNFTLGAVMFTITFSFFVISTIVINQMMMTDVEERTYEFAMLRTLGFNNYSFIVLINIQTLIYSVPATIMGFILLFIFNSGMRLILYFILGISVDIHIQQYTYMLGILTGIIIPLVSNIFPIRSAMSHTLRDSLD
jgi:ABC-type antimicrobial peptide transport system permease subunit